MDESERQKKTIQSARKGKCRMCKTMIDRVSFKKHLPVCIAAHARNQRPHYLVLCSKRPFVAFLLVDARATFKDIDNVLRGMWVECCGHLSSFEFQASDQTDIPGRHRGFRRIRSYMSDSPMGSYDGEDAMSMADAKVENELRPGVSFLYSYDFGTTTVIGLEVIAKLSVGISGKPVEVLLRNRRPIWYCKCGKQAVTYDQLKMDFLCQDDLEGRDPTYLSKLSNSPRFGECAYESTEEYRDSDDEGPPTFEPQVSDVEST